MIMYQAEIVLLISIISIISLVLFCVGLASGYNRDSQLLKAPLAIERLGEYENYHRKNSYMNNVHQQACL